MKIRSSESALSVNDHRQVALQALWVGLIVTVGVIFVFIPNIELISFVAFLGGIALGARRGLFVAVLGEAIFSAFNPIGSGLAFPVLYMFQLVSVGLAGLVGGLMLPLIQRLGSVTLRATLLGVAGFMLTLIYDILTSLSLPISTGMTEGTIIGSLSAGIFFYMAHLVSNTLIYSSLGPPMIKLVNRQLLMHRLLRA
ncbi:MAG: hypothetical protein K9N38_01475 [Candidatus Marinimicrobia bacterium]|nr:hypothetical protein [Candidatus Neomarinimicrobiota bacterium]MCF7850097.1 hypothetical protein [Candidatus Neomarinimicrobiota bacterium]